MHSPPAEPVARQPLRLLIVEDSKADAEIMVGALRQSGYDPQTRIVATEPDYLSALDEAPDLVLCDYTLPQFDGMRALELLTSRKLNIPFILVSGTIGEELAVQALQRGAADYLLKDRLARLGAAVQRALELGQARKERRRREHDIQWLAAIVESTSDAIVSRGLDDTIKSWNAAAERMFGWSAWEAVGQPIEIIVPPERSGKIRPLVERVIGGETMGAVESTHRRKDGTRIETSVTFSAIRDPAGEVTAVSLIYRDITESKRAQEHIAYLSQYDTLTGLPNRNLFRDRIEFALMRAKRNGGMAGVMLLDVDRFRKMNESLGLDAGDELLRQLAARLKDELRELDTVARLGADEFAILVEGILRTEDVTAVADKIIRALAASFKVQNHEVFFATSIGIAVFPNGTSDPQELMAHAQVALSRAKQDGGGSYQLFEGGRVMPRGKRLNFESRLRHALENGELTVHYQPKVSLATGIITGMEALLRWNNPELGQVSPAQFIPVAEETGLIVPIGEWVLHTACAQAKAWEDQELPLQIAVNLSPRQFRQKDLPTRVSAMLVHTGLAPANLELEITESTAMTNPDQAIAVLGELRNVGVKLAVDDFGTGYSSLSYLKRFPLNRLKIDRAFVKDLGTNPHDEAIINATIALAGSLSLDVTAEGVETEAQRDFLARAGCDEYQGFHFSRPLPAEELSAILRDRSDPRTQGRSPARDA